MRKIIVCLFLVVLTCFVFAQKINVLQGEIIVDDAGFAEIELLFIADSSSGGTILLPELGCQELLLYDETGLLEYEGPAFVPREITGNYSFSLSCTSNTLTKKDKDWLFSVALPEAKESSLNVALPENAVLLKSEPDGIVYAENSVVSINFSDSSKISIYYSQTKEETGEEDYLLLLFAACLFLAFVGGTYFFMKKRKPGRDPTRYLSDAERKIFLVVEKEKRITQRKLQIATGLPKSTLSRTLKKLENTGFVKTTSAGSTKFIELEK